DSHAGGLVDSQQVVVLINNGLRYHLKELVPRNSGRRCLCNPDGGHTDLVTPGQLVVSLDPSFVNTDLTLAQQTVYPRLGYTFQVSDEEIINTLANIVVANVNQVRGTS